MGLMKNRRYWTTGRLEQNKYPSDFWDDGPRITSQCPSGCISYWEHLNPRPSCPRCGARMVITETTYKEETHDTGPHHGQ
jgi:hypothetical protein